MIGFAVKTQGAGTEADLDAAARDLAAAITIIGVDAALAMLFRGRPTGTFKTTYRPQQRIPSWKEFRGAMPPGGPRKMYPAEIVFTRSREIGRGGTVLGTNKATIGRQYSPQGSKVADAVREVRKTVHHERVHQRLTQAFSLLGRPALYAKLGAYKRSYILRYLEEAAAETYALARAGGAKPGEIAGYKFPLNGNYDVTLAQMGAELKGVLLGPVVLGGATYQAWYGSTK